MRLRFALVALVASALGCSSKTPGGGDQRHETTAQHFDAGVPSAAPSATASGAASTTAGGGTIGVALAPKDPKATDTLVATVRGAASDAMLRYQWSVDGQDIGWGQATLPPGHAKKKQTVRVTATAVGVGGTVSPEASAEVAIVDAPPTATASGAQQQAASGGTLVFQINASDPDGDPLSYNLSTPLAGVSVSQTGALTISTSAIPAAGLTVPVEVSDPDGQKSVATVSVRLP